MQLHLKFELKETFYMHEAWFHHFVVIMEIDSFSFIALRELDAFGFP